VVFGLRAAFEYLDDDHAAAATGTGTRLKARLVAGGSFRLGLG
jgi:hypothetical protein